MCVLFSEGGQPIPNLLLGSIPYLLMNGDHHPLKKFYPSRYMYVGK